MGSHYGAGMYLWRFICTLVGGGTRDRALTCQATNQGIHYTFCSKSYLQKYQQLDEIYAQRRASDFLCTLGGNGILQTSQVRYCQARKVDNAALRLDLSNYSDIFVMFRFDSSGVSEPVSSLAPKHLASACIRCSVCTCTYCRSERAQHRAAPVPYCSSIVVRPLLAN